MSLLVGSLYAALGLDMKNFESNLNEAKTKLSQFGDYARTTMVAVGAAMGGLVGVGVKFNADMEQANVAFTTLLGSAKASQKMLADLKKFSAETPFEFPGIEKSAKLMLAMGFNAQQIMPNLQSIGDAVAAIGGNQDTLNGVTMALGQMLTKGKVSAEEMNQLAERGIGGWEILSQKLGKSKAELMKMAEQGKLLADEALPQLLEGLGEKYAGAMEKQSKTFNGLMSTLKDLGRFFLGDVTKALFDKLKGSVEGLSAKYNELQKNGKIKEWADKISSALLKMWDIIVKVTKVLTDLVSWIARNWSWLGKLAEAVIAVTVAIRIWRTVVLLATAAQWALNAAMAANPIGLVLLAIGGLTVALGVATDWFGIFEDRAEDASKNASKALDGVGDTADGVKNDLDSLMLDQSMTLEMVAEIGELDFSLVTNADGLIEGPQIMAQVVPYTDAQTRGGNTVQAWKKTAQKVYDDVFSSIDSNYSGAGEFFDRILGLGGRSFAGKKIENMATDAATNAYNNTILQQITAFKKTNPFGKIFDQLLQKKLITQTKFDELMIQTLGGQTAEGLLKLLPAGQAQSIFKAGALKLSPAKDLSNLKAEAKQRINQDKTSKADDAKRKQQEAIDAANEARAAKFAASKDAIETEKYFNRMSLEAELKAWQRVKAQFKAGTKESKEAAKEIYRVQQELVGKGKQKVADQFEASKKFIENQKYFGKLSLEGELKAWRKLQNTYKAGTAQRLEADREAYRVRLDLLKQALDKQYKAEREAIDKQEKAALDKMNKGIDDKLSALRKADEKATQASEDASRAKQLKELRAEYAKYKEGVSQDSIDEAKRLKEEITRIEEEQAREDKERQLKVEEEKLEKQRTSEEEAIKTKYEKLRTAAETNYNILLEATKKYANSNLDIYGKNADAIVSLLESKVGAYKLVGQKLGQALSDGVNSGFNSVSNTIGGGSSKLANPFSPYMGPPAAALQKTSGQGLSFNGPMVKVDNMVVRNDADVQNVSKQLYSLTASAIRAQGGRI